MVELARFGGALGCVGLALLLTASRRDLRLAGLGAWTFGAALLAAYLAPAGFGLDKPTMTVTLVSSEKDVKPIVVRIGDAFKEDGKVVGHHGAVEGRNVLYVLPHTSIEAMLKSKF